MSFVTTQEATVYKGGDRRYFTKHAAYRNAAKAVLRERMDGEWFQELAIDNRGRWERILASMMRYWKWKDGLTERPRKVQNADRSGWYWSTRPKPKALRCQIMAQLGLPQSASIDEVKRKLAEIQGTRVPAITGPIYEDVPY